MLNGIESLSNAAFAVLFVLGLVTCCRRGCFRLGVLMMLTADLVFVLGVLLPGKFRQLLASLGAGQSFFEESHLTLGLAAGLSLAAAFFLGRRFLPAPSQRAQRAKEAGISSLTDRGEHRTGAEHPADAEVSAGEKALRPAATEHGKTVAGGDSGTTAGLTPGHDSFADPALFASVKRPSCI